MFKRSFDECKYQIIGKKGTYDELI
jgi:hypothetical protein